MIQRHLISRKDKRNLMEKAKKFGNWICKLIECSEVIEVAKARLGNIKVRVYLSNGKPLLIQLGKDLLFPSLHVMKNVEGERQVYVDDGAVKHILRGADVMVPGIVKIEGEFSEGDIVLIRDRRRRLIAIAKALMSSDEVRRATRGRALKNIHYWGDKIFKMLESL